MLGVLALLDRLVVRGAIIGREVRSGPVNDFAVKGGVGMPFEYPSREPVRPIMCSSCRCEGKGNCCEELGVRGREEGKGGVSAIGEK
jgi:hypothetical protein